MEYKFAKIHESASVVDSSVDKVSVRIWSNTRVDKSSVERNVSIGDDSIVFRSEINKNCDIGRRNIISHSIIEKGVSTQGNTTIRYASIGKYTSIAWNVTIGAPNHDMKRLAMAQLNYIFPNEEAEQMSSYEDLNCIIGNDVWIAAGAHVTRGVTISDGVVVAANAVVTKDVPPYAIVAGVPAKVIGYRFSDDIISDLMELKWWDFSDETLKSVRGVFDQTVDKHVIGILRELKERRK